MEPALSILYLVVHVGMTFANTSSTSQSLQVPCGCAGVPGIPRIPGQHGRDGLPGLRGNDGAK
ncbi:Hypothetical predicted protein, partial [Paramuricea clavata]